MSSLYRPQTTNPTQTQTFNALAEEPEESITTIEADDRIDKQSQRFNDARSSVELQSSPVKQYAKADTGFSVDFRMSKASLVLML